MQDLQPRPLQPRLVDCTSSQICLPGWVLHARVESAGKDGDEKRLERWLRGCMCIDHKKGAAQSLPADPPTFEGAPRAIRRLATDKVAAADFIHRFVRAGFPLVLEGMFQGAATWSEKRARLLGDCCRRERRRHSDQTTQATFCEDECRRLANLTASWWVPPALELPPPMASPMTILCALPCP